MIRQSDGEGDDTSGNLVSEVGNEIKVTLDRWSVGQLGVGDLIVATAVIVVGAVLAWLASRLAKRIARRYEGAARTAIATVGLLLGSSVMLLAVAVALEVLGFSLGPVLVLILLVVVALLLLRPLITNLSSGLLLQVRGALSAGDLIRTNGVLGTVHEINARSVVLETSDGRQVHVPNSDVLNDSIANYTALGRRRSSFDLMVDGSVELERVVATVERAVRAVDSVLRDPPPEVQASGIVGPLIVIRVHFWHPPTLSAERATVDRCVHAVVLACKAEGIALDGPNWMVMGPSLDGAGRSSS